MTYTMNLLQLCYAAKTWFGGFVGMMIFGASEVSRNVDLVLKLAGKRAVAGLEAVLENVRHGDKLDRRATDGKRIGGSAGAAAATAHEGDLGGIVLSRMDEGDLDASQRRDGDGGFQEATTRGAEVEGVFHEEWLEPCVGQRRSVNPAPLGFPSFP